jgi:hypothetical protein
MVLKQMKEKNKLNSSNDTENSTHYDFRLPERKNKKAEQSEQKEIIRRLRIQNKKLQEQVSALRIKVKQQSAEKTEALNKASQVNDLNDRLSQALGSCHRCWGEDPNCPICSGDGISGWRKINKRLFNVYVFPANENL